MAELGRARLRLRQPVPPWWISFSPRPPPRQLSHTRRSIIIRVVIKKIYDDEDVTVHRNFQTTIGCRSISVPVSAPSSEYVSAIFGRTTRSIINSSREFLSTLVGIAFLHYERDIRSYAEENFPPVLFYSESLLVELGFSIGFSLSLDQPQPAAASFVAVAPEMLVRGRYEDVRGKFEEEICAICLEKMQVGEDDSDVASTSATGASTSTAAEASRLPCSHVFHTECVLRSLKHSKLCPVCRHDIYN